MIGSFAAWLLLLAARGTDGFSPPSSTVAALRNALTIQNSGRTTLLSAAKGNNPSSNDDQANKMNNNDNEKNSLEQTRMQLEALLVDDNDHRTNNEKNDKTYPNIKELIEILKDPSSLQDLDSVLPPPPPLTAAERDRRLAELQLLEQLASSDDAAQDLGMLSYSEKGPSAQERLEQADEMMSSGMVIASEQMLFKLLEDYGIYWVEPLNRLATLYFRQGRLEESYHMCQCVLHLKPWHLGALDGIVEICRLMGNRDEARSWAERRLPNLVASTSFPPFITDGPANPERARWVHAAIQEAQEALSRLEYQTQRDFLGKAEEYYTQSPASTSGSEHMKKKETKNEEGTNQMADTGATQPESLDFGAWE